MPVDPAVMELYRSGVAAVVDTTRTWTPADWARPACGTWTGADLAGHLVTVIGWYHDWLDRGLAGITEPAFPAAELTEQTGLALAALAPGDGPSRIDSFVTATGLYADRLHEHWDAPFAYPRGTVTAGLHVGVAAAEWHLHTWDFASSAGGVYVPLNAEELYLATARCLMAARGGVRGRLGLAVARRIARRDPWHDLLRRSGRHP